MLDLQREFCRRFGASFLPADDRLKVGFAQNFDPKQFPLNGLRHPLEGDTTGWYIWSGEDFSEEEDFSNLCTRSTSLNAVRRS
jgi:hypothetical protein